MNKEATRTDNHLTRSRILPQKYSLLISVGL